MTPLQREALQMCLEYIETDAHERRHVRWKINEALAEPQQEPVAWRWSESNGQRWFDWTTDWSHHGKAKSMGVPIEYAYTSPPARKPLTDEQIDAAIKAWFENEIVAGRQPFAKRMRAAIKAANSIKENT